MLTKDEAVNKLKALRDEIKESSLHMADTVSTKLGEAIDHLHGAPKKKDEDDDEAAA